MKHLLSFFGCILLITFVWVACKKKEQKQYTCKSTYSYIVVTSALKGFSTDELKMVILTKYVPNSQFDSLKSIDTLDLSNSIFSGDTAYSASSNQWTKYGSIEIKVGNDYRISIPAAGKVFSIDKVHEGPKVTYWTQDVPCPTSPGASQSHISAVLFDLNNQPADIYSITGYNYLICLQR